MSPRPQGPAVLEVFDLTDKLVFLEERLGGALAPGLLAPFEIRASDPVDLQRATRRIAEHVGLGDRTFVVGVATQREHQAGHIELGDHGDVFIEDDLVARCPHCAYRFSADTTARIGPRRALWRRLLGLR